MNEKNNQADKKPSVRNCTEELLGELFKNVSMGKESLLNVMPKVKNDELRAELTEQLDRYSDFCRQIKDMLSECGEQAKGQNIFVKMTSKIGIEMNTLTDPTDEHIAQMVIEGTTMGITDTIRAVRDYENSSCSEEALAIARKIVSFQEKSVESVKKFL